MSRAEPDEGVSQTLFALMYRLERGLRPFDSEHVRRMPRDRTGVYAIWLPQGASAPPECLYVGISTTCMRTRLLSHLHNETNPDLRSELRLFGDVVLFSTVFTVGESEIFDLETSLIQRWQPRTNRNKLG